MPYKEHIVEKVYFTIGDVAERYKVATSLIRFWESEFKQIKPKRNRKGNRNFTKKDIKIIDEIYYLVKIKGFTLEGAKEVLEPRYGLIKCPHCLGIGYVEE